MEQLLFYRYQKFKLEQYATLWGKLKRIPFSVWGLFAAAFASMVACIVFLCLFRDSWSSMKAVMFELMCAFAFSVAVENYHIQNSQEQMEKYWEYCSELRNILAEANVHTQEDIEEIKERVEKRIHDMKAARQASNVFWSKLGEIIAVPVILAIITASIGKMDSLDEMVIVVISMLLVAGAIFASLLIVFNLFRFPKKRKMEQMIEFCEDLQGVVDMDRFGTDVNNLDSDEK